MSREEARKELYLAQADVWYRPSDDAIDMAIKALEQEPVFDRVREEIDKINLNEVAAKYEDRFYGFQREVIKIIDKYKAESAHDVVLDIVKNNGIVDL